MARLRAKYTVQKISGGKPQEGVTSTNPMSVDSPFVLFPGKDPAAFRAMLTYAESCETELGEDILSWLGLIAGSPPPMGTQGQRNVWQELGGELEDLVEGCCGGDPVDDHRDHLGGMVL